MIKYISTAIALKLFSINQMSRSTYRRIGNTLGAKRRENQNIDAYIRRGDLLVKLATKHGLMDREFSALEIGTGWIHWFALYLAIHSAKMQEVDVYDVWDNRQFNALRSSFRELGKRWVDDPERTFALSQIEKILDVPSFEDLYTLFDATYTVDEDGSLAAYSSRAHELVFSFHVLEHVGRDIIRDTVSDMYRILKPGGYCIHQIGIDDHLTHYDKAESPKKYIAYSMATRKRFFENSIQYHNVLQANDYIKIFEGQGFEVIELDRETVDIDSIKINKDWQGYSTEDLETTILTIVCKKPLVSEK